MRATIRQACGLAQIGRSTLYRWIAEGLVVRHADGTVDQRQVEEVRALYATNPRRVALDRARSSGTQ